MHPKLKIETIKAGLYGKNQLNYNKWIFHNDSPKIKRSKTFCYSNTSKCPEELEEVENLTSINNSYIIPYFNWLEDSFMLMISVDGLLNCFGGISPVSKSYEVYLEQMKGLMNQDILVGPSVIVIDDETEDAFIFIEYKEFPSNVVKKFSELSRDDEDLHVVQYSLLLSDYEDVNFSDEIRRIIKNLPSKL